MPVEDHEIHPSTQLSDDSHPGCFNRKIHPYYLARDGYHADGRVNLVKVEHRMSTECRYDFSLTDMRCGDCNHRGSGEAYAAKVRAEASK